MDWSVQQIAKMTGTTGRTLRHYDHVGLLPPSRTGNNGYRYYGQESLVRLQRILLLRDLGLGLPAIAEMLRNEAHAGQALAGIWRGCSRNRTGWGGRSPRSVTPLRHWKREERSWQRTCSMASTTPSIGKKSSSGGARMPMRRQTPGGAAWGPRRRLPGRSSPGSSAPTGRPRRVGRPADGALAQALARRHVDWLRGIPGTPAASPGAGGAKDAGRTTGAAPDIKAYVTGLGEMYVADARFAANYGGPDGAAFVRDALRIYAEANL